MRRTRIELTEVASTQTLAIATQRAIRGRRQQPEVVRLLADLERNLTHISAAIRAGELPTGMLRRFTIHDPKRRTIHAPPLAERIFHHALMHHAGPVLERSLTDTSYACREGMGALAAVQRAQQLLRRHPWYVKTDIDAYFDSIDQPRLFALLQRRFKGEAFLAALWRVIDAYQTTPGRGLPIGALTSQHFANLYLDGLDRLLLERLGCPQLRYMDDTLWFCASREEAVATLAQVRAWLAEARGLEVKPSVQINRSAHGVTFCGYRITPGALRLTRRRKQRYTARRAHWEGLWRSGEIDARQLQQAHASVHGIVCHADALGWRKEYLRRHPAPEV